MCKIHTVEAPQAISPLHISCHPLSSPLTPSQLPFVPRVKFLERLSLSLAPLFMGRTAHHLFLSDSDDHLDQPPLLLRMTTDCEDGAFV